MPVRAVLAAVVALVFVFASPGTAAAQSAGSFGAEPIGAQARETAKGWFTLEAAPGARLDRSIRLRNTSSAAITFGIGAVGASTMDIGGVSYDPTGQPGRGAASWVSLPQPTVTVAPGAAADVPFSLQVPADALPGDHLTGLAIWDEDEVPREQVGEDGFGATLTIRSRRVIALQLTIEGAASTGLAIDGATAGARPDGPYLLLSLSNTGRRLTTAKGIVRVPSEAFEQSFSVDTFVPGTSIQYPVKWPHAELPRDADIEVVLDVAGGGRATFAGTISFGDDVRSELTDRVVDESGPGDEPAGGSPAGWTSGTRSGLAGGALLLFLALLAVVLRLRWRSRRRTAAADLDVTLGPAPGDPPSRFARPAPKPQAPLPGDGSARHLRAPRTEPTVHGRR